MLSLRKPCVLYSENYQALNSCTAHTRVHAGYMLMLFMYNINYIIKK